MDEKLEIGDDWYKITFVPYAMSLEIYYFSFYVHILETLFCNSLKNYRYELMWQFRM